MVQGTEQQMWVEKPAPKATLLTLEPNTHTHMATDSSQETSAHESQTGFQGEEGEGAKAWAQTRLERAAPTGESPCPTPIALPGAQNWTLPTRKTLGEGK